MVTALSIYRITFGADERDGKVTSSRSCEGDDVQTVQIRTVRCITTSPPAPAPRSLFRS
jgi:hypothetical protein